MAPSDRNNQVKTNYIFIEGFTYYHLLRYLEKNNPNTASLTSKLFKPEHRDLGQATRLWKLFIKENGITSDIYGGIALSHLKKLSIDHFLPWSFVTHDQLWNLHPVEKKHNSAKGNYLPSGVYFDEYTYLQYDFTRMLLSKKEDRALEDYYQLFKIGSNDFKAWSNKTFQTKLKDHYLPQFEIAGNMGFVGGWKLTK